MFFRKIGLLLLILIAVIFTVCEGFYVLPEAKLVPMSNKPIVSKSIGMYIINMNTSKERHKNVQKYTSKLPYPAIRIDAIDGNLITNEQLMQYVDLDTYYAFMSGYPKSGTVGCFLSHAKAWREFLSSSNDIALILEDDIVFNHEEVIKAVTMLQDNSSLWDIASLEISHKGSPLSVYQSKEHNQKIVAYLTHITHMGAYLVSRSAAVKLLAKSSPIKMPVDHYFTRSWELGTRFVGVDPVPVFQPKSTSEIESSKNFENLPDKIWLINQTRRGVYVAKTHIANFAYNFRTAMKFISKRYMS